nr:D-alanyl-D-alanine carboxypeptidase/D-alanyl-D-alanine-endopeptidase [uncultured Psychrobacter sp.]
MPITQTSRRLSSISIALVMLAPISAQAVLPAPILEALTKAELAPADISIMVIPIGQKDSSRLPPIVQVVTLDEASTDKASTDKDGSVEASTDKNSTGNDSTLTSTQKTSTKNQQLIAQQDINEQERQLNSYTDDPYTHLSLDPFDDTISNDKLIHDTDGSSNAETPTLPAPSSSPHRQPLLTHQADIARTPASTMKLIPSFIALDTLGADFVWHTRVYHTGLIVGNRLQGDLIIQGSGDPKMTHERLRQLLYQVTKAGIRHVDGDIIVDSTIFANVTKDPAAFDNAPLRPYNASPDGFLINFNTVGIRSYLVDNNSAKLTYKPTLANYQLPSSIGTRQAACAQASSSLAPDWQADKLVLNASLPVSCAEHVFYVAYPDAKDFGARVVASKWQQLGNTLDGRVIAQDMPYQAISRRHKSYANAVSPLPIASYPSLNLTQQIYDINHFSNNVMTEQVALSLGAYSSGNAQKNTSTVNSLYYYGAPKMTDYPQALARIDDWWRTHLSTPPPYLTNGSGLCRECTLSAANLGELLSYAYTHPSFDAYVSSLGVAGVSGTISSHSQRFPESAAIGRAWIKTGTLNNVTSMAGYVKGLSGQDYAVVGIINTEQALNAYRARPVLDALLDWSAQR